MASESKVVTVPTSEAVQQWWPLADSLDLVRARADVAAPAVLSELTRFVHGDRLATAWVPFTSLSELFGSVSTFTGVPTVFFVIPTASEWAVLWNNGYGCDGYDSLCYCLTTNHGLTTMHWQSSDGDAVFQAGSSFTFRAKSDCRLIERSVYCGKNDNRWDFHTAGEPLPEEDLVAYTLDRKRDRLNEQSMIALLARLGARPWEDDFYPAGKAFRIERVSFPKTITQKRYQDFACKRLEIDR